MEPFSKVVNDFQLLNIFTKKLHRRFLFASSTSMQFELILTEWEFVIFTGRIEASKMSITWSWCVYCLRETAIDKEFYKKEKHIKEVMTSPPLIFY